MYKRQARRSPGYLDVDPDETDQEVDTKDKKGLAIEHEHHDASRSFARAVSISSLETVIPGAPLLSSVATRSPFTLFVAGLQNDFMCAICCAMLLAL